MSETDTPRRSQQPSEHTAQVRVMVVRCCGGDLRNEGRGAPREEVRHYSHFVTTISVVLQRGRCLRDTHYRGPNGVS